LLTLDLTIALAAIDDGLPVETTARLYGMHVTSLRNHLFGKSVKRRRGPQGILTTIEEDELVQCILKMQRLGHPLLLT
jgi:hypothetical protein